MSLRKNLAYYGRFKSLPWFSPAIDSTMTVFGQGGIGSWLTLFLARTGTKLYTVDMDTVEEHNIAGQVYGKNHVGKSKVNAMNEVIGLLCGENRVTPAIEKVEYNKPGRWKAFVEMSDVVCVTFDSIQARQIVYEYWQKAGKRYSLFVDGRMSIENGEIFTLTKYAKDAEVKYYESNFFDDSIIPQAACTLKATSHCGALIASLMTSQITNYLSNRVGDEHIMERAVENHITFNLPLFMFDRVGINNKEVLNNNEEVYVVQQLA